jgi:hypothetical protein
MMNLMIWRSYHFLTRVLSGARKVFLYICNGISCFFRLLRHLLTPRIHISILKSSLQVQLKPHPSSTLILFLIFSSSPTSKSSLYYLLGPAEPPKKNTNRQQRPGLAKSYSPHARPLQHILAPLFNPQPHFFDFYLHNSVFPCIDFYFNQGVLDTRVATKCIKTLKTDDLVLHHNTSPALPLSTPRPHGIHLRRRVYLKHLTRERLYSHPRGIRRERRVWLFMYRRQIYTSTSPASELLCFLARERRLERGMGRLG